LKSPPDHRYAASVTFDMRIEQSAPGSDIYFNPAWLDFTSGTSFYRFGVSVTTALGLQAYVYDDVSGGFAAFGDFRVDLGTWHRVELDVSLAAAGSLIMRVDGTAVASLT